MLVPHRAHIPRVGLEQQFGHRIDTPAALTTDWTSGRVADVIHRSLDLEPCIAVIAGEVVFGHRGVLGHSKRGSSCRRLAWVSAALAAVAKKGQVIDIRRKPIALQCFLPDRLDNIVGKLDDFPAFAADQVMVAVLIEQLELPHATPKVCFGNHPQVAKKLQRAIDGGSIDSWRHFGDAAKDFFGGEMLPRIVKCSQDQQALRGGPLTDRAQVRRQ